ncbi:hypothetical protein [Streptomyces sp. NPDC058401]
MSTTSSRMLSRRFLQGLAQRADPGEREALLLGMHLPGWTS